MGEQRVRSVLRSCPTYWRCSSFPHGWLCTSRPNRYNYLSAPLVGKLSLLIVLPLLLGQLARACLPALCCQARACVKAGLQRGSSYLSSTPLFADSVAGGYFESFSLARITLLLAATGKLGVPCRGAYVVEFTPSEAHARRTPRCLLLRFSKISGDRSARLRLQFSPRYLLQWWFTWGYSYFP